MRRGGALVLLLLALAACSAERDGAPAQPAPDFTLPDLDGNQVTLSELRGKTVLIDFWATWCPPCVYQVPVLNAFWDSHRESGQVVVLGVAVDFEGAMVVGPWAEEHDVRYPILLGDEDLARRYGVIGFPALVLVDPAGDIVSVHSGVIRASELEALLPTSGSG